MVCESWKTKLDTYLDGEIPENEMRAFDAHVRSCASCSSDALARIQMKRAIQSAGSRFTPSAEFRKKIQRSIAAKPRRSFRHGLGWMLAAIAAVILVAGTLTSTYLAMRSRTDLANRDHALSEIADLHVETLASASPVDVVSTDRHTVKPWFQGKIPFAFNLPELQNSQFSLLGGRMTYLDQTPGAHLIYDIRKHHISVFIFQEKSLSPKLAESLDKNAPTPNQLPFNTETWSQSGLRYFVIGDASPADIDSLAKLFKAAS
ncbi:MAG TPA: zf-HC2 domain-containing protein [Terriglobales bacterium]|jgi:anti-sigma factor RsiW|nr:zf-HC2 domain-containing protein [Terriglobales bacterium]